MTGGSEGLTAQLLTLTLSRPTTLRRSNNKQHQQTASTNPKKVKKFKAGTQESCFCHPPSNSPRTMFSSISTMIWGEEEEAPTACLPPRSESPAGEDWVLVGSGPGPAPGDLSALEPLRTPSITPLSSTSPSSPASEAGEEADLEAARAVNHRTPNNRVDALALAEVRGTRAAQLVKQKNSGKSLSSKALKRSNKAVHAEVGKRHNTRNNFAVKMAGNRTLKQC